MSSLKFFFSFLLFSSLLTQPLFSEDFPKKKNTLELIEWNLYRSDSYFGVGAKGYLDFWYEKISTSYKEMYPNWESPRGLSNYSGFLVLDLDRNVLLYKSEFDYHLPTSLEANLPKSFIKMVIKKALDSKMFILLLSSGLHDPDSVQKLFNRDYDVSKSTFKENFDIIVASASKVDLSHSYKGLNLALWLLFHSSKDDLPSFQKILFLDDCPEQIQWMKWYFEEFYFSGVLIQTSKEGLSGKEMRDYRRSGWMGAFKIIDAWFPTFPEREALVLKIEDFRKVEEKAKNLRIVEEYEAFL